MPLFSAPLLARVKADADIQNVDVGAKLMVVLIKVSLWD